MDKESFCINIITVTDNINIARKISRTLLQKRLISGAQIEKIESIYIWEKHQTEKEEYKITMKSTEYKVEECFKLIKELSNYKCPEIIAQKIDYIDKDFKTWILEECISKTDII